MKTAAILVNILIPGIGSFLVGKWVQGIFQLLLLFVAVILVFTGVGVLLAAPLSFVVWLWAIISAATTPSEPVQVIVVQQKSD